MGGGASHGIEPISQRMNRERTNEGSNTAKNGFTIYRYYIALGTTTYNKTQLRHSLNENGKYGMYIYKLNYFDPRMPLSNLRTKV